MQFNKYTHTHAPHTIHAHTPRDGKKAEKRRKSERTPTKVVDAMWETGETWAERRETLRHESVGSIVAEPIIQRIMLTGLREKVYK